MERFEKKILKTDSCWIWQGATQPKGYGTFRFEGKVQLAHRVSYKLYVGGTSNHVLHRCDNPSCVNPSHLFEGTNQDNVDDKMKKGRHNCRRILTSSQVDEIKGAEYSRNLVSALSEKFNVSKVTIWQIRNGQRRNKLISLKE